MFYKPACTSAGPATPFPLKGSALHAICGSQSLLHAFSLQQDSKATLQKVRKTCQHLGQLSCKRCPTCSNTMFVLLLCRLISNLIHLTKLAERHGGKMCAEKLSSEVCRSSRSITVPVGSTQNTVTLGSMCHFWTLHARWQMLWQLVYAAKCFGMRRHRHHPNTTPLPGLCPEGRELVSLLLCSRYGSRNGHNTFSRPSFKKVPRLLWIYVWLFLHQTKTSKADAVKKKKNLQQNKATFLPNSK